MVWWIQSDCYGKECDRPGLAIAAEEYGSKFYANGASPSAVLEHPGTLKDPGKVRDS